jgi:hypothetical protein
VPAGLRPGWPVLLKARAARNLVELARADVALLRRRYRRPPTMGAPPGATVELLGDVFIKLLPDGLAVLLAPAAALPALLPMLAPVVPPVALPVGAPPAAPVVTPVDGAVLRAF